MFPHKRRNIVCRTCEVCRTCRRCLAARCIWQQRWPLPTSFRPVPRWPSCASSPTKAVSPAYSWAPSSHSRYNTSFYQYGNTTQGPVVGPLIDVREGDTVEIRFVNRLPQPSTIHWHGLPVPPGQDGNPSDALAPGATRVYRFTLPSGSAGTYWYHPHPHMKTAEQVFRGLAGPIVVRSADDPLAAWPERHLFLSDLRLASDGSIPANDMMDWMNGREGQFVLVNGARR